MPNDDDRDHCGGDQVLAGRPEQQSGNTTAAAAADHYYSGLLSRGKPLRIAEQ